MSKFQLCRQVYFSFPNGLNYMLLREREVAADYLRFLSEYRTVEELYGSVIGRYLEGKELIKYAEPA